MRLEPTGGWEITLLEIGRARHPGEWVGPGFPEWMWTPMNGLLLRRAGRTIVVDTGSGALSHLWPFEGIESDAPNALAAAGVAPGEVDTVVLTHLDDDHIGGLFQGAWPGEATAVFPNARVVARREAVKGVDDGEGLPVGVEERRQVLELLRRSGALDEVAAGEEIAGGVRLRDAPGHRAGHSCIEVGGELPLVHIADTLHHASHVEHPDWDGPADDDRELALATRTAIVAELAASGTRAVASHLSGVFTISASGDGFTAVTVEA